jgi:hypothetical protein
VRLLLALLAYVFTLTLTVSAALLFWVQPMFARMALPLLGGTPAVWNTCVVFFQAALLAGYAYSHLTPAYLGVRRQAVLQLVLVALPLLVLPIAVPEGLGRRPDYVHPALWLLALLLVGVGLPFFVVSTTAPLLQRWFAATGHPAAGDPYFLYAASNFGSMVGLLSYPFLLEQYLPLEGQTFLWMYVYWVLAGLVAACAVGVWAAPPRAQPSGAPAEVLSGEKARPEPAVKAAVAGGASSAATAIKKGKVRPAFRRDPVRPHEDAPPRPETITRGRRLLWVLLAFVPSSLMLSVTTYLTTDVAPIPLLWVIPLALYLLTFILAFARRRSVPLAAVNRTMPLVVLMVTVVLLSEATEPIWLLLLVHLLALFWIALLCHGTLARLRPDPRHLTEFYFWLSLGGVLGGMFNALVAPVAFSAITEYPLVLVLACLLRGPAGTKPPEPIPAASRLQLNLFGYRTVDRSDLLLPLAVGVLTAILVLAARSTGVQAGPISLAVMFALPAIICYTFQARPLRFGLAIGALLLASSLYPGVHGRVLYRARNFFGVHKVVLVEEAGRKYHRLIHGNTIHGQQSLDPDLRGEPLAYFHKRGPVGRLFHVLDTTVPALGTSTVGLLGAPLGQGPLLAAPGLTTRHPLRDVGVVGLGAGSLAAYAQPGQRWTFFEIDPEVIYLARDSGYFTFLRDCRAETLDLVEGDARLMLDRPGDRYDLLVIDAFSSDALPVHLFTREALRVYLARLNEKGILAFHISNRYLDMARVLGELARDAGLVCLRRTTDRDDPGEGLFASEWVVMGRPAGPVGELAHAGWQRLPGGAGAPLWTDDHTNIFTLLK